MTEAKKALDAYLKAHPVTPGGLMFRNDEIGGEWNENTLQKTHRKIREAAGIPKELQVQDFRTTVQTRGGAAGGTVDELRGFRQAAEHYVYPGARFAESIQRKRLTARKQAKKVGRAA